MPLARTSVREWRKECLWKPLQLPQLNQAREQPMLAQLFSSKYGIEIDANKMNSSYFVCERIS